MKKMEKLNEKDRELAQLRIAETTKVECKGEKQEMQPCQ